MEPGTCATCAPVTHCIPILHIVKRTATEELQNKSISVAWNVKLSDLASATKAGCAFCSFVLDRFFHRNSIWVWLKDPAKPWYRDDSAQTERDQAAEHALQIAGGLEDDTFSFSVEPSHSGNKPLPDFDKLTITARPSERHDDETTKKIFHIASAVLEVYAVEGDQVAESVTTRPPNVAPASTESFKNARNWIQECVTSHPRCRKVQTQLPTRVIEIGDGENLRLDVSRGTGHYAALSYCWGGVKEGSTTTSNLHERIERFKASELPQTLQDAVRATLNLGLKYLWTDAQCILQDSDEDKGHEVSRMGNIYKNAYVTICAARAENAREGFLEDFSDEETKLPKDLFPMSYRRPDRNATTVEEAFKDPEGFSTLWVREETQYDAQFEPVTSRAWTLQERLLSPRFLYYGSRLIWQCNTMQRCNGGVQLHDRNLLEPANSNFNPVFLTQTPNITFFGLQQLFETWYQTLDNYTRRKMTMPSDKLPAIAGIAAEVSRISGVPYLAGLWKNNLLHDLLWTSNNQERFTRPSVWRAPTWSWASVDSVISYGKITSDATEEAEVLDCEVEPRVPNEPFGEVKSGKLKICGPFAKIKREDILELLRDQGMAPAPPKSNSAAEWNDQIMAFIRTLPTLDDGDKEPAEGAKVPEEVYCMVTHSRHWTEVNFGESRIEKLCYFGLLLEKTPDGNFERLASFDNQAREWLTDCTSSWNRETITLV